MNDIPTSGGITRRSFIKRSVVAAVAVSSMTIFSGLVNAAIESPSPGEKKKCKWTYDWVKAANEPKAGHYLCWYENEDGSCTTQPENCGVNHLTLADVVTVDCKLNQSKANAVWCYFELIA